MPRGTKKALLTSGLPWHLNGSALSKSIAIYWRMVTASGSRPATVGSGTLTEGGTVGVAAGHMYTFAAVLESSNLENLATSDSATVDAGDIDFWAAYWFYPNSIAADSALFGKDDGTLGVTAEYNALIDTPNARWRFYGDASVLIGDVTSTGSVVAAAWNFLFAYHSSTSNEVGISLNGSAFATAATTGAGASGVQNFFIGSPFDTAYFDGRVGPLAFGKNYIPTSSDVSFLYNGGSGRK